MKSVRIADLKARLSEFLRLVRGGDTVVVLDRDTPVAQLVPYAAEFEPLQVRPPRGKYDAPHQVPLPKPLRTKTDVVALLLAERQVDR